MYRLLIFITLIIFLASCKNENPIVVMETDMGDITIEMYAEQAPITSNNFMEYISQHRYEGATFYRTVTKSNQPGSKVKIQVIQGGLFEDDHPQFLPPISHESTNETGIRHLDGIISMARYEPGTATFEFFICVGDQPSLDYGGERNRDNQGFAAFGRVISGMDVVHSIHKQPEVNQYLEPRIKIRRMRILH